MEALVSLLDKYVETFFVGFLLVAPAFMIANANSKTHSFNKTIAGLFGLNSDHNNFYTLRLIVIFLVIFSSGLFFKSVTYLVFGTTHEKVIAYTECRINSVKDNSRCENFILSKEDFLLGLLSKIDRCREESYLNHLSKQAKWFILQRESYSSQIESIGRNITITQGFMFSAVMVILVSLIKLIFGFRNKAVALNMSIYLLCGVAFYLLCFKTWWALEERYHMRIIVSEQFLSKENDHKEDK